MTATDLEILHAYRHLFRAGLRAVLYEKPHRFVVRDRLRDAFRKDTRDTFDAGKISRTIEFLQVAARVRGLEYKVTKNIVKVWGMRTKFSYLTVKPKVLPYRRLAYAQFDRTVTMLNHTMGMCIK